MTQNNEQQAWTWGMLCHLASLVWIPLIFVAPFPFINILGPLVVWVLKKNEHPFIDAQGKESLNFQISFTLYSLIVGIIAVIVALVFVGGNIFYILQALLLLFALAGIWLVLLAVLIGFLQFVLVIIASVKASNGEFYRYPFTIRFIK